MPDEKQQKLLTDAREMLKVSCMARFGFSYEPAPPMPRFGPRSMTDLRYGIHDDKAVARYGYKPPVDLKEVRRQERLALEATTLGPEEEAVMTGGVGSDKPLKTGVPSGGCAGEAYRAVVGTGEAESTLAMDLGNQAYVKAQQEPKVKKAFSGWVSCMAAEGFRYQEPMAAVDDPKFASDIPSAVEIATAKADLKCRDKHQVAEIWHAAEVAIQQRLVEENSERLTAVKNDLDQAVKKASDVLAKNG
ncbi:hypothetical protein [Streptomyces roseolus]|uniref:hypothetical protein n=1 Tax=Streptomyces roseolus TaxID=67358 RepID=UPI0037A7FBC8